jgi:CBS domain containing-hemolysin-like protein
VGEIRDEHDEAEVPPVIKIRTRTWMVRGDVSVKDLQDRLEMRLEEIDARTVGGLVAEELGRLPTAGDKLEIQGLRLKVLGVEGNRVLRVRVEQRQRPSDEDD